MMTTEDSSFTPAPKRHGDRIWIRFDPEDTLASALEKARGDLGPGARFRGWDTHYAVYIFLALGRAPEPGDTVTLPTSPRDIRSVTETASRRIWAVANQSLSQRRPVWSHREQRMRMTQAQPGRRPLIRYAQHAEESSMRIREISPLGDSERMLLQTFGINVEAFSYPQQERLNALLAKVRGVRGALLHSTVQCRVHNGAVESATTVKLNGEELVIGRSYNPKEARLTQFIRCRMGATRVGAEHVLECSPKVVDEFTVRTAAGDVFNGLIFGGFDEDTAWTEIVGPTVVEVVPLNGSSGEMKRLEDAWIAVGASDGARSFCGFGCGSNDDLSRILKVPSEEEAERHALELEATAVLRLKATKDLGQLSSSPRWDSVVQRALYSFQRHLDPAILSQAVYEGHRLCQKRAPARDRLVDAIAYCREVESVHALEFNVRAAMRELRLALTSLLSSTR